MLRGVIYWWSLGWHKSCCPQPEPGVFQLQPQPRGTLCQKTSGPYGTKQFHRAWKTDVPPGLWLRAAMDSVYWHSTAPLPLPLFLRGGVRLAMHWMREDTTAVYAFSLQALLLSEKKAWTNPGLRKWLGKKCLSDLSSGLIVARKQHKATGRQYNK